MACSAHDIPKLEFPRDEIIEIIPASYNNSAKRIKIDGVDEKMVPGSPEGPEMPVPPSGTVSPFSGVGTPAGAVTPVGGVEGESGGGAVPLRLKRAPGSGGGGQVTPRSQP